MEVKTEAVDKKDSREEGERRRERRAYSLTAQHNVLSCPLSSLSLSPAHGRGDCTQLTTELETRITIYTNKSVESVIPKNPSFICKRNKSYEGKHKICNK